MALAGRIQLLETGTYECGPDVEDDQATGPVWQTGREEGNGLESYGQARCQPHASETRNARGWSIGTAWRFKAEHRSAGWTNRWGVAG